MPKYIVRSPDGVEFEITAPEEATEEQVLAYAKANMGGGQPPMKTPAQETSAGESALIAAGRTGDRIVQGIRQGIIGLVSKVGDEQARKEAEARLAELKANEEEKTRFFSQLEQQHPVATALGGAAPLVAAPILGGGPAGMALSAAVPAALEYGTPEERAKRAALAGAGGLAGYGAGVALNKVIQPFKTAPGVANQAARDAAERIGVNLRADEITQSRPLKWAAAALNDLPFSGGMAQTAERAREAAISSAAAKSMGQTANEVTEGVFANARQSISNTFNRLLNGREITLDKAFQNEVKAVTGSKVMRALRNEDVQAVIEPFQQVLAPGWGKAKVSGEWFQQNKTALDSVIRSAYNSGENGKARALESFERALERAAKRSMSPEDAAAYEGALKQWASLRLLETGKVVEGGKVMPGRLDSVLTSRYKNAYKEGKITGELPDIAKLAQVYKPMPQSGTTPRAFYSGLAGGAAFANPLASATMLAAPPLLQKFLQSKAGTNYLSKGLIDLSPEAERLIRLSGAGLLSGAASLVP